MDLRIVNTCNNNCLYCLEKSLRSKDKFIDKKNIFEKISDNNDFIINFYWWNSLLHPDFYEIISFCKTKWYSSIWVLTNWEWINEEQLSEFLKLWLTTVWLYFNSFSKNNHQIVNWNWISYSDYLKVLQKLSKSWINLKIIIHVNNLNIKTLYRDVLILNKKYWVKNIDFVNYFPFDKPYENRDFLEYLLSENKVQILKLFSVIEKLWINFNFLKFSKEFFFWKDSFYDFEFWVKKQIWEEDLFVLNSKKTPFCYKEKRCKNCFLKDVCSFYK